MAAPGLAPSAHAAATCDLYASPLGSDSGPGTISAPFRTVQELADALGPGQTGCLESGVYYGDVRIAQGGSPDARVTLASYPGQTATIAGRLQIIEGANYVTVTGLQLDGANPTVLPSPTIDSNHDTFSYDDVTNDHTGICFAIGSATWGWATGTLITHDQVHGCGQDVPGDNYQHGFYIGGATDTTIEWSMIYGNAARGIQLYPDAQHTTIDHNIISGNGEGILIGGEGGAASSYTNVYDNVISDATTRHDVESWWSPGNPIGVDNRVHDNCIWGGREGTIDSSSGGFTADENLTVNPRYTDRRVHDFEMSAASPCLVLVGDVQAAVEGTQPVVPEAAVALATRRTLLRMATRRRLRLAAEARSHRH
ncbi:MAG TPA: right-handed parallel beta-helix repeat-containing protein [Solirubrobacteraceae bacterium]|nr:right-handed parallel beta-helix repeat-containing protein [Solirubrobacteraceae bacterium]